MRKYNYDYPHPAVTTDIVIFSIRTAEDTKEPELNVLLVKRGEEPFKGKWALPGGFLKVEYKNQKRNDADRSLLGCAKRELEEETGVKNVHLEQVGAYGDIGRDPRQRVVTVAFFALIPADKTELCAKGDAAHAEWVPYHKIRNLAFDHRTILEDARKRLASKVTSDSTDEASVAFEFLPKEFTLSEVQSVFEAIKGEKEDKRNFRKRIRQRWPLEELGPPEKPRGRHRPASLFRRVMGKSKP